MQENILNEILMNVRQTNEKIDILEEKLQKIKEEIKQELRQEFREELQKVKEELRQEFREELQKVKEELRQEFNEKLIDTKEQIVKELSSDIGKQFNDVMIVISRVENQKHEQISNELKQHQEKAVKGVELLKETLVS